MPLDAALFILLVRPRAGSPGWIDFLVDGSATGAADEPLYAAHKDAASDTITLLDALSLAPLGRTHVAPPPVPNATPNAKHRLVALDAPAAEVHLRNRGGLAWGWEMEWEGVRYTWGRDVVSLVGAERGYTLSVDRKPDPSFPILVFSPRKKGGSIEVLDYNLDRIEPPVQDRKGLEIASLLALSHFIDHLFALSEPSSSHSSPAPVNVFAVSPSPPLSRITSLLRPSPPVPPPEAPRPSEPQRKKSGLTALATNEVEVTDASEAAMEAHCERCLRLLEDPALLYLSISTTRPAAVPAVAALAERVKRKRYKLSGEEVKLFVDDDGAAPAVAGAVGDERGKGKKAASYAAPPTALKLFLSRIDMADLLPNHRRRSSAAPSRPPKPPIRPPINFDEPASPPTVPAKPAGAAAGGGGGARLTRRPKEGAAEPAPEPSSAAGASGWFSSLLGGRAREAGTGGA
ncbi:hypothetical protein JCM10450v2_005344 [Rhodotorula kratochvilovae]